MFHHRRAIILFLGSLLFAFPAFARTELSGTSHVAFDHPDAWATSSQGQQVVVQSPDHNVVVEVDYVTTGAEVQRGIGQLQGMMASRFQQVVPDGPARQVQQRGLNGPVQSGTAVRNGHAVRFFVMVLGHPGGGAIVVGFIATTSSAADLALLRATLDSFRRI